MDVYTATELAYKNGYAAGARKFAEYLKAHSFMCDPDHRFSFSAIDVDDLDDHIKNFLSKSNVNICD